jgi:hypothetical protein
MLRPSKLLAVLALALGGLASGCASDTVRLRVQSTAQTNAGLPFYVVVRSADSAEFLTQSYDGIASGVFATPKDKNLLHAEVVYPGVEKEIEIEKPQALPLGIYFMFSKPGDRWKTSRAQPLPSSVDIELDASEIKQES